MGPSPPRPLSRDCRPAAFYGRAGGVRIGVGYVPFGMGAPQLAGEFVQGGPGAGAGGGGAELIGEHRSPFRDPLIERTAFRQQTSVAPRKGLARFSIFGEDYACHSI